MTGRTWRVMLLAAVSGLLGTPPVVSAQDGIRIQLLSSRPTAVTGGDALIRVTAPTGVPVDAVRIRVNGRAAAIMLRPDAGMHSVSGLITGLVVGPNVVSATIEGRPTAAELTLTNFSITGPVLSGPHEQPFICETEAFELQSGGTLGPSLDANCSVATRVDYLYQPSSGGDLEPLPQGDARPSDLATVTTGSGATLPFIVRIETGTINRAIYQIAMLHDPATPAPDFARRSTGWNGRLIYTFGGGCVTGWYRQGRTTGGVDDVAQLSQGYAVASASLNVAGNNCGELVAAETMMMVKERFIEAYGTPLFTIGMGSSGGSYQTHQIGDNYPGLLDGIISGRTFPDLLSGTVPMVTDARLLQRYFEEARQSYTDEQKRQISGFGRLETLTQNNLFPGRIHATEHCPEVLPATRRYDPANNLRGVRCGVYDHALNVLGRDPRTGFARRPLDNVGVQYGLAALNTSVISKEQFLDLNERVGGYDHDGNVTASRSVGDEAAIVAEYSSGRLTNGGLGLASIPMIDYRGYMDDAPRGDIHVRYQSFSMRERLLKANGHIDNHVMLTEDNRYGGFSMRSPVLREALRQMDQWLTAMTSAPGAPSIERIRRTKPADLVDACWTRDAEPRKITEPQAMERGECEALFPSNSFPRGVAGAPAAGDIVKCQLKPVSASDYMVAFTPEELARLRTIFPIGACDWSKPGVAQQKPAGVWQTFGGNGDSTTSASGVRHE